MFTCKSEMWHYCKTTGSEILKNFKGFFGIFDKHEDIDNLRENYESRVECGYYGISVQKSLPEFMQTNSHKKNKALKQMKKAFSQVAVDQLNQNELQELIKTSTHGMISCPDLSNSSGVNIQCEVSQNVDLPTSSHTVKVSSHSDKNKTLTSFCTPVLERKRKGMAKSIEGITRASQRNVRSNFQNINARTSQGSLQNDYENMNFPSPLNVESGIQNHDTPLFQSSIRLRCSNTAKLFSPSNNNVKESFTKGSQIYKLEDFVLSNDILKKDGPESLKAIASIKEFENEMSSVLNTSHGSCFSSKTLAGLSQEVHGNQDQNQWKHYNESADDLKEHGTSHKHKLPSSREYLKEKQKSLDSCNITAKQSDSLLATCDVKTHQTEASATSNVKQRQLDTPSVSCSSKQSEMRSVIKAKHSDNVKGDHLSSPSISGSTKTKKSASWSSKQSKPPSAQYSGDFIGNQSSSTSLVSLCAIDGPSDKNNSAMLSMTYRTYPVEFEANVKSLGLEVNINNHAVGSSTEQENLGGKSLDKKTGSTENIIKTWPKKDCNLTDFTELNKGSTSYHNWPSDEIDGEEKDILKVELLEKDEMLTGKEALEHYLFFTALERAVQIKKLEVIKEDIISDYNRKIEVVDEIYETAKSYYSDPRGQARKKWKDLRKSISQQSKHSIMDVREGLAKFGHFIPVFTYLIIVVQVMSCSLLCSLFGVNSIGMKPKLEFKSKVETFLGHETIHRWRIPNMWIGVSMHSLIAAGGVFGLCMRDNIHTRVSILHTHNFSKTEKLGCCEIASRNTAGTTTKNECSSFTLGVGSWHENILCSKRASGKNSVAHNIKPCCIDLQGVCIHTSHSHCLFVGGIFHQFGEHCSQINCANDICKLGGLIADPDQPWLPKNANQWGRLFLSLFYTQGIIHGVLIVVGNWIMTRQLERSIGWLRILIVYTCCGMNGVLCAAIFSPYTAQVGTTASLMGTVGVILVELSQGWKLIDRPWIELAKICALMLFSLFLGSMPLVSNYAIVTGFCTGMICAVAFLPYITFGRWDKKSRLILCISALIVLLISNIILLYMFHYVQDISSYCESCRNFDCLSYTEYMCDHKLLYYSSETKQ